MNICQQIRSERNYNQPHHAHVIPPPKKKKWRRGSKAGIIPVELTIIAYLHVPGMSRSHRTCVSITSAIV
eukprot:525146-Amorphochlora_amoeboformis.AAC.1